MILDIYRDHLLESLEVDHMIIFDRANGGEIGIYKDHVNFAGVGSHMIYNKIKKIENFLYNIENNIITIYLY